MKFIPVTWEYYLGVVRDFNLSGVVLSSIHFSPSLNLGTLMSICCEEPIDLDLCVLF